MRLLDTKEAAQRLGVSERRVRFLCKKGKLGTRVSGRWVITEEELGALKRSRRPRGRPKKSRRQ